MSEIINKYILDRNVDDLSILLRNNQTLLSRNSADDGDVPILRVTASDVIEFSDVPQVTRDAVLGNELVRFSQIQNLIDGLNPRASVEAATTANIVLLGVQTIDGVAVLPGDSVLVKDQINPAENGVYTVDTGVWNRRSDTNTAEKIDNAYVFAKAGSDNAGNYYLQVADVVNLGVDPVVWDKFNSNALAQAGGGIDITAGIISVDINIAAGLKFDSDKLSVEPTDFAGFGLEDDGIDNLRLSSSGFGNGLTGGSGVPVSVDLDSVGGANIAKAINLSANGLGVKVDDATITENGSGQLTVAGNSINENYITTSIAGLGLSGGDSLPLSVNVDDLTIEIDTDTLRVKDLGITEAKLNSDIDAQTFDTTYTAVNYTPTAVGVEATTQISAHIKGIDLQLASGTIPSTHASTHISGASDPIQSEDLAQAYVPSNYTRTVNGTTVTIADSLGSHLLGIDNALGAIVVSFEGLSDTTFTDLTSGELAVYNGAAWINQTLVEAGVASTTHASTHITGASDEIDGDQLNIDWEPANYSPATVTETTSLDDLSSHLKGIDDAIGTIPPLSNAVVEEFTLTAGQITSGIVLSNLAIPASVTVISNGSPTQFNSDLSITDNGSVSTVAFSAGLQPELIVGDIVEVKYLTDVGAVGVGTVTESRQINTDLSLTGGGDLSANRTFTLLNDTLAPGNSYYYGTNSLGSKGWYLLPTEVGNAVDLADLQDVTITTVANNELLAYNTGTGEWINQTPTEAGFATVSTSGDYGDLINTPTSNSSFTNGAGYLLPADIDTFTELQAIVADETIAKWTDPLSQFTNDSNFITALQAPIQTVNSLTGAVVLDSDDLLGNRVGVNYTATTASTITQHLAAIDTKLANAGSVTSVNTETGAVVLAAADIDSAYTPTNYTQASATIDGHLDGINTELGKVVENPFELQDIVTVSATSDLLLAWANNYVRSDSASAINVTVQPEATIAHTAKTVITIRQVAAGQLTLVPGGGVTLNVRAAEGLKTAEQHAEIQLTYIGSDVWDVRGGIS